MKKLRVFAIFLLGAALAAALAACRTVPGDGGITGRTPLVRNAVVTGGTLSNGMSWLTMRNSEPENRIYLRLAVRAGAILEDDDQKGIAHLVEHMAFNGTEHFAKNDLIDYFESIGMSFGPEINAYTGFDETVYMLEIPADDPAILEQSLLVMRDWAAGISFDPAELDKERGVVIEEWRLGRGASGRVQDRQIPFLLNGSRYAGRLPIGDPEIIKKIPRERVVDFYRKWYRPELMSIILVGDADPAVLQKAVEASLGTIPASASKQKRPEYPSKAQKKPGVLVIRDPEISYTTIQLMEQVRSSNARTAADLRRQIASDMAFSIFNNRLAEKTLAANPQMLAVQAGMQQVAKPGTFSFLGMVPSEGNFTQAFKELLAELGRIELHGVTEAELEREKSSALDGITQAWLERDKLNSAGYAGGLVQSELYGDVMISVQDRYDLYRAIVPQITLAELKNEIDRWYTGRGKLLLVTSSEKATDIPSDAELLDLWQNWKPETVLAAYTENNLDRPLYDLSGSGKIVKEQTVSRDGIKQWTLSNGARVLIFPTAFKANEVLFSAFSKGGSSLVSDADFPSAAITTSFAQMSGLNGFSAVELQKKLAGKTVSAGTWLDENWEGLYGSSSTADMETLLQLANLSFTRPYFSADAYDALLSQLHTVARSRQNEPDEVFSDLKTRLMYGTNVRRANLSEDFVNAVKPEVAEAAYRARFADAGDFTFVFAGSLDEAKLKQYVETYIASLPSSERKEEAKPLGIAFPAGVREDVLKMGIEAKSRVFLAFGGRATAGERETELFDALASLLQIRLREVIREDMSGSYGVRVSGNLVTYPETTFEASIEFGCEPGREESLARAVLEQIEWLESAPVPETYMTKLRENWRRDQEEGLRNNRFWLNRIASFSMQGRPLDGIAATAEVTALLTGERMQAMAKKYFDTDNYVKAVLMPKE